MRWWCVTMNNLNDIAWGRLFDKYNILDHINDADGEFFISAAQIKEFREPRLMTKFDCTASLPALFTNNQLAILPITRGDYVISHFDAYHKFENNTSSISHVALPTYIQSLDANNVPSEAIALNCAVASGIIAEFLEDEALLATVSGRMGTGTFDFNVNSLRSTAPHNIRVSNSQMEIDAAYEGVGSLALIEAKCVLADDFLIRQLYYPYRAWRERVTKSVRTIFLIYSNGIYHLYEYGFQDPNNYNSLVVVKQGRYSVEDTEITVADIQATLDTTRTTPEPQLPFPQANSFERVINLCELLNDQELSKNDITEQYAFDVRQTEYYTAAARYLGLVEKKADGDTPIYSLSENAKRILGLNFKQRQLAYCKIILSHKAFADTLRRYLNNGDMPSKEDIVQIMKSADTHKIQHDSTFERRSATVKSWINWIVGLINE